MPVERRGWVIAFEIGSTGNGRNPIFNGRRQPSCGGDPNRCLQAFANHLHLAIFESTPEVRVLSSAGITRLQRSNYPVRLPPMPPPEATLRPLPSHQTGLPRLPEPPFRRAVPTTPADRAGARVDCFPAHAAFPKWQEGRHPHCHFRGLLRLHSRYGPPNCSAAHRRPLSRGSNPCGYPHKLLVSYRINRQLSGWILPPLMIRAFGAHCQFQTNASNHACFNGSGWKQ